MLVMQIFSFIRMFILIIRSKNNLSTERIFAAGKCPLKVHTVAEHGRLLGFNMLSAYFYAVGGQALYDALPNLPMFQDVF